MAPPIIRIDDEVLAQIRQLARPLEDTPNSVLRRVFDLPESPVARRAPRRPAQRRARGQKTPQGAFREHLLAVLRDRGGKAGRQEVMEELQRQLTGELTEYDLQTIKRGSLRWQRTVDFERLQMTKDGLLESGAERGLWALSDRGREAAGRLTHEKPVQGKAVTKAPDTQALKKEGN